MALRVAIWPSLSFKSLYGFGERGLKIRDVCMDFEPFFKAYNYNLGQNLLRHITKILIFCTHPDKNAYCCKLKDCFPPPLLQCCFQ